MGGYLEDECILINGQSTERLAVNDRGAVRRRCFTTARIAAGEVPYFPSSRKALWKKRTLVWRSPLARWDVLVKRCAARHNHREGVLKLMITRGTGGRGYSTASCQLPTRILSVSPYPATTPAGRRRGHHSYHSPHTAWAQSLSCRIKTSEPPRTGVDSLILSRRTPMRLVLTARDGLRNAVRLICSGVQATLILRRVGSGRGERH